MRSCFLILAFLIGSSAVCQQPKQTFILKINGKEYLLNEGEELKIDSFLNKPVISISLPDYKTFIAKPVSFQYPHNMAYEFEKEEGVSTWTLNGNELVIMFFEFAEEVKAESLAKEMMKKFGEKNCQLGNTSKKLGGKTLNGKKLNISLAGQKLTMDLLEVKLGDGKSRLLVFQDSVEDFDNPSEEAATTLKLIDNTISYDN